MLVGGFFIVNLILAVINESFINESQAKEKVIEQEIQVLDHFKLLPHKDKHCDDPFADIPKEFSEKQLPLVT